MKQYWQKIEARIDAMTLRERVIIFGLAALIVLTLVNQLIIEPQFRQQKMLSQQVTQDQVKITEIQMQIRQKSALHAVDPDAALREQLKKVTEQSEEMHAKLGDLQKGLVPPDRMAELLKGILSRNEKLQLISLKTLAPAGMNETVADNTAAASAKVSVAPMTSAKPDAQMLASPVYKHGVELVMQGSYQDMVQYMADLEAMPWQVFWGRAVLDSSVYSKATLTLNLYTLSMDKQWLNL